MNCPKAVAEAAKRIARYVVRTPLLEDPLLNAVVSKRRGVDVRVVVKAESLQRTGAFKFRGALNRLLQMDEEQRAMGVCAFSSGNFAQALAYAASITGTKCTIVCPHDAPVVKMARTRAYGATVVMSHAKEGENREVAASSMVQQLSLDTGAVLLHPFDDWQVIHGQGTLALELYEQLESLHDPSITRPRGGSDAAVARASSLVIPCGGGGMTAGCVLATQHVSPSTKVFAVEPKGYDDHVQSFANSQLTPLSGPPVATICDALQANAPGQLTWEVNGPNLAGAVGIGDDDVVKAVNVAFDHLRLVLEPSGALGLAAVLNGSIPASDGDVLAVVACGGNVSRADYQSFLRPDTDT